MIALSMIKYSTAICFTNGIFFFFFIETNLITFIPSSATAFYQYSNPLYISIIIRDIFNSIMNYNSNIIQTIQLFFQIAPTNQIRFMIFINTIKYASHNISSHYTSHIRRNDS